MLPNILDVLKFITDSKTGDFVKSISKIASQQQVDCSRDVIVFTGRFRHSEWYKIKAFANELFSKILETGINESKYKRFKTVFSELVTNAYKHGCRNKKNCYVRVRCKFSRWYIQLEVSNTGKGMDLEKALKKVERQRIKGYRQGKSGLEIVSELTDVMEVKKSQIVVIIAGEDRIKIHTEVHRVENTDLLLITVEENDEWGFLPPKWESLRDTLEKVEERLILVRFGKYRTIKDEARFVEDSDSMRITHRRRMAKPIITECALDKNHFFAYVTADRWVYEDMRELEKDNLRFFRNSNDAYFWLKDWKKHLIGNRMGY